MEELIIAGKEEPWEEELVFADVEGWSTGDSDVEGEDPAARAQALLDQLDIIKIEEPFSDWYEEKTDFLPLEDLYGYSWSPAKSSDSGSDTYGWVQQQQVVVRDSAKSEPPTPPKGLPQGSPYTGPVHQVAAAFPSEEVDAARAAPDATWVVHTPQLIQEFETVLQNTLTPPQTPPRYSDIINIIQDEGKKDQKDLNNMEIDQLVQSRVESLCDGASSPGSEWSDHSTAPNSTTEEDASFSSSESDLDWALPIRSNGRKRTMTSTEEKRLRKKEQNKNAATRYRQKKKAEQEGILEEEREHQEHNAALKEKVTEMQREIKYLKSLMRDVCRAKGLIK